MSILFNNPRRELISLTDDWTFHYAFGRDTEVSKKALIAILNVILDRREDPIVSITILNPIIYADRKEGKDSVLDIKAITNSNQLIDIEMQGNLFKIYPDRSLFYGGRLVNSSLEKGENYDKLKKSIVISIVDGVVFEETEKVHTVFKIKEVTSDILMTDKLEFHFLELGKINESFLERQLDDVEKLATYLKYANNKENEDYLIKLLNEGNEAVTMAENIFRELTEDDIAYEMQERRLKYEHDLATFKHYAREEGLEEGREVGREEGREEGYLFACRENAKRMMQIGISIDVVCQCTGLTEDEIKSL